MRLTATNAIKDTLASFQSLNLEAIELDAVLWTEPIDCSIVALCALLVAQIVSPWLMEVDMIGKIGEDW